MARELDSITARYLVGMYAPIEVVQAMIAGDHKMRMRGAQAFFYTDDASIVLNPDGILSWVIGERDEDVGFMNLAEVMGSKWPLAADYS